MKVRLMFQDEAGFGRINRPRHCWCPERVRPSVPCHYVREYEYAYGAVEPKTGESFFLILPCCNAYCMNLFLEELSKAYPDDLILLVCDGAMWHKEEVMKLPGNIQILHIPPYTPEMNPIEQVWSLIRRLGFRNECFASLDKVTDRLCDTINSLTPAMIHSVTWRSWMIA